MREGDVEEDDDGMRMDEGKSKWDGGGEEQASDE